MNLTWKAEVGTLVLEQYLFQNVLYTKSIS